MPHDPCAREQHLSLTKAELLRWIASDRGWPAEERSRFSEFARILDALIHAEYHETLERLKSFYAPFDPERLECTSRSEDEAGTARSDSDNSKPKGSRRSGASDPATHSVDDLLAADAFFDEFVRLMEQANYRRLADDEIHRAMETSSDWGLHLYVDIDSFERLEVFVRGADFDIRQRRRWRNLWRPEEVDVPIFRRLVVAVRMRTGDSKTPDVRPIYLKVFKNIPHDDVDMLLPGARFRMTWVDQGKIILPTLSGVALAIAKVVMKSVAIFAIAGVKGLIAMVILIAGTLSYGAKSFFGYLRTKDKYQLNLTRCLYYQNLDNNAGVICRLLDEAEEQEFAEASLAYALLARRRAGVWTPAHELDELAEAWLRDVVGTDVDFDLHDAIAKLVRFGLVNVRRSDESLQAVPLEQTLAVMDRRWDARFRYDGTQAVPRPRNDRRASSPDSSAPPEGPERSSSDSAEELRGPHASHVKPRSIVVRRRRTDSESP